MKYSIFFPKNYKQDANKKWPLIVFLHGARERGDDISLLKINGPLKVAESMNLPFLILAPQCEHGEYWESAKVIDLIDLAIEQHAVDQQRIYLTGLSMGGFGTWQIASHHPEKFAAIAPICGGGTRHMAFGLKNTAIWVFHGANDIIVPLSKSQEMVDYLAKEGNHVKFTIYQDTNHDAWTKTYENPELYDWFLQHSLSEKTYQTL